MRKDNEWMIIRNPRAGRMLTQNMFVDTLNLLFRSKVDVFIYNTKERGDAITAAKERGVDYNLVVACGGDGTLNEVINGLMEINEEDRPKLGYLPAGTTNDFASSLGIPKTSLKAARSILGGEEHTLDICRIDGGRYFSYVASFGSFSSISYTTAQQNKNLIGYGAYIFEAIKNPACLRPYNVKVTLDDTTVVEGEFLFGATTNSTSVAGLFKLDRSEVHMNDGVFEVLLLRFPRNIVQINNIIYAITAHEYKNNDDVILMKGRKVVFECEDGFDWTIDGEFAGSFTRLGAEIVPNAIKIVFEDTKGSIA